MTRPALIYATDTLESHQCGSCGIWFAAPVEFWTRRRDDHSSFYCPNGHARYFSGKSEAEKERDRRIRAEARAAHAEDQAGVAERRRRAEKGHRTRIQNRIRNGICPWCKRSFADVAAHVASKHPDHPGTTEGAEP